MKQVILYHQPGWGDCRAAEEFLRQRGVPFEGKDIQADPSAYDELVYKWKSRATATLVIDGEVIRGFQANRGRVEELLA
jgi:glutaredoxin 3